MNLYAVDIGYALNAYWEKQLTWTGSDATCFTENGSLLRIDKKKKWRIAMNLSVNLASLFYVYTILY